MPLKLHGRSLDAVSVTSEAPFIARLCRIPQLPSPARSTEVLLVESAKVPLPSGFRAYFLRYSGAWVSETRDVYRLGDEFAYLDHGDIVRIEPQRGSLAVLYRRASRSNTLLVTERCDNYCTMCSQPPKQRDETGWLEELQHVISLMSPETREIGITGGEPGLLGQRLIDLVDRIRCFLPRTAVHILSNGRSFADADLARAMAKLAHPDLMIGIPLYSDLSEIHDFVVQARGAYDQTIRGILNLKRHGIRVELRFVVHRDTYRRLPDFARFVVRNLLFLDHVALMGLEHIGFARANLDALWIDPLDYQAELTEAVEIFHHAGMAVSIYNHQLCVLPVKLWAFAQSAISDWKNVYTEECTRCAVRYECGGFFASSVNRPSRGISAVAEKGNDVAPNPLVVRSIHGER